MYSIVMIIKTLSFKPQFLMRRSMGTKSHIPIQHLNIGICSILKNKGYLENYGKSVDVFEELQEHQPEAIQYAKERVERLTRDQVAVICRDSNPVTTVYELVEFLNSKRT